jgi:uncharacterized protein DUF4279
MPIYLTDEDGNYTPEQVRARARLVVLSDELTPDAITEKLGIVPDSSWRKGESAPTGRPALHHGWELASRLSEDRPVEDHLADVLARTAPVAGAIAAITTDPDVLSVRFWLVRHGQNWNPGLSISSDAIRLLGDLGTGVEIDIYVEEEDPNKLPDAARPAPPQLAH